MDIQVKKRNGRLEKFCADKINKTAGRACNEIEDVNASELVLDAQIKLYDKVTTESIDQALIEAACAKIPKDPNWSYVAARLSLDCIYKEIFKESTTAESFKYDYQSGFIKNLKKIVKEGYFDKKLLEFDLKKISEAIKPERDYKFSFMGIKNLQQKYLFKLDGKLLESPQAFWMRVAMGLSLNEKNKEDYAIELYNTYSQFFACSSTPNLFNSGTVHPQTASCFLSTMADDANSIGYTIWQNARMSKYAGGLGIDMAGLRASGSHIKSTNGTSSGPIPFAKMVEAMIISFNQSGKRAGSAAVYLEPWHLDIKKWLELRKVTGDEWARTHKLNPATWYPDAFFNRMMAKKDWYLFDPKETPDLHEIFGEAFDIRYQEYADMAERGEIRFEKMKGIDLWREHMKMLFETGHPWVTFKDAANIRYSNQHEGIIHNTNLCVAPETLLLTDKGWLTISKLAGQKVNIWNGKQWSETEVVKTAVNQKLTTFIIQVDASDSSLKELVTTSYHKFCLYDGRKVEAHELKEGDHLCNWSIDGYETTNVIIRHIIQTGRIDDTYCVNEPIEHKAVFNGILTFNCTEVFIHDKPTKLNELGDILEHGETAVCQLGSINGKYHVENGAILWDRLKQTVKTMVRCIDNAIDINFFPTHETQAHLKHRPIGLGFMGMQDVCYALGIQYDSQEGVDISNKIQEFISYHAILSSSELAKERGVYSTYEGSLWSKGLLPQDTYCNLMKYRNSQFSKEGQDFETLDWSVVREYVAQYGMRNSNTMAIAPTAGISYLQNCEQSIEPSFECIAVYNNDSGTNYNINAFQWLKEDLKKEGKWNSRVGSILLTSGGNIKNFDCSERIKNLYRSCWDRDMIMLINAAAARQIWIDQGQSLNIYYDRSDLKEFANYYKVAWEKGLKSTYYMRNKKASSIKKIEETSQEVPEEIVGMTCSMEEGCLSCQ